jgi:hypothetical protein
MRDATEKQILLSDELDKKGRYEVYLQITHREDYVSVSCALCKRILFHEGIPVSGMHIQAIVRGCAQMHAHHIGDV